MGIGYYFFELHSAWIEAMREALQNEMQGRLRATMDKEVAFEKERRRAETNEANMSEWEGERRTLFIHIACEQIQRIHLLRARVPRPSLSYGLTPNNGEICYAWQCLRLNHYDHVLECHQKEIRRLHAELGTSADRYGDLSMSLESAAMEGESTKQKLGMSRVKGVIERMIGTPDRRAFNTWKNNASAGVGGDLRQRLTEAHRTGVRLQSDLDAEIIQRRKLLRGISAMLHVWPNGDHIVGIKLHATVTQAITTGAGPHDPSVREMVVASRAASIMWNNKVLVSCRIATLSACVKRWYEESQLGNYTAVLDNMAFRQGALRVAYRLINWSTELNLRCMRRWQARSYAAVMSGDDTGRLRRNLRKLNGAESMFRVVRRWESDHVTRAVRRWYAGARMHFVHNLSGKGWQKYLEAVTKKHEDEVQGYIDDMAEQDQFYHLRLKHFVSRPLVAKGASVLKNWMWSVVKVSVDRWHEKAATKRTYRHWAERLFWKYAGKGVEVIERAQMIELVAAISLYDGVLCAEEVQESLNATGATEDRMELEQFCSWIDTTYAGLELDLFDEGMSHLLGHQALARASTTSQQRSHKMKMAAGVRMNRLGQNWVEIEMRRMLAIWEKHVRISEEKDLQAQQEAAAKNILDEERQSREVSKSMFMLTRV